MFFATASLVFETRSVAARWKDAKPSLPEYKLQLFTSATSLKRTFVLPGRARLLLAHMRCLNISGRPPLRDITKIRKQRDYIEVRGLPQVVPASARAPATWCSTAYENGCFACVPGWCVRDGHPAPPARCPLSHFQTPLPSVWISWWLQPRGMNICQRVQTHTCI